MLPMPEASIVALRSFWSCPLSLPRTRSTPLSIAALTLRSFHSVAAAEPLLSRTVWVQTRSSSGCALRARDKLAPLPYRSLRSFCARSTRLLPQNACCQKLSGCKREVRLVSLFVLETNSPQSLIDRCSHFALVPLGCGTSPAQASLAGTQPCVDLP